MSSNKVNFSGRTKVTLRNGEEKYVPFGEGIAEPDADNVYCHQWSDMLYYKYPEKTEATFANIVAPEKMFITSTSGMEDSDGLSIVSSNFNRMKVVEDLVRFCCASGTIPFLWGPPGHAKTSVIESYAEEKDELGNFYNVESIEISKIDATIFDGIYAVDEDFVMRRSVPEMAWRILSTYRETGRLTILLMDEITLASAGQLAAALRIMTHLEMGNIDLSDYMCIIAACNPKNVVRSANKLSEATLNRSAHFSWALDFDLWYSRWSRGFVPEWNERDKNREPSYREKSFARNVASSFPSGKVAFESMDGRWNVDNLVPSDLDFSPRSFHNYLKTKKLVDTVCRENSIPSSVKNYYNTAIAASMLGDEGRAAVVRALQKEDSSWGGYEEMVERLKDVSFESESPVDNVDQLLYTTNGSLLGTAEITDTLDEALSTLQSDSRTAYERSTSLVVACNMALAARSSHPAEEQYIINAIADMVRFLNNHREIIARISTTGKALPSFVDKELKERILSSLPS